MEHYDGTRLLSMKDINGNEPEIYICAGNRTGGKTTFFNRMMVNGFIRRGEKFMLLYRYNYDIDNVENSFFDDIHNLFFPNYTMTSVSRSRGMYKELWLKNNKAGGDKKGELCGFAVTLNSADTIKRKSHLFTDVQRMLMDEFQSETNNYCDDEITKFRSVHTSVARGGGKAVRRVPVYMCSNTVSMLNPYYAAFGIGARLKKDTKFLRGPGFIFENYYNPDASKAQIKSGFNAAFVDQSYLNYAAENVYLDDNLSFIEKPQGHSRYICSLKYMGNWFAVREFESKGYLYCDRSYDATYPKKICVTTDDMEINGIMLTRNDMTIQLWRKLFRKGGWRFKDLESKECIMSMLQY